MREWAVPRSAFAPVVSFGYLGMMIGGAIAGLVGDRVGRRTALLGMPVRLRRDDDGGRGRRTASRLFGCSASSRGSGLGGAIPNAAALSGEYVPLRHRPLAVTVTSSAYRSARRWPGSPRSRRCRRLAGAALFFVGGALPFAAALVLPWLLPESPRFLARLPDRRPELIATLRRMRRRRAGRRDVRRSSAGRRVARAGRRAVHARAAGRHDRAVDGVLLVPAHGLSRLQLDPVDAERRRLLVVDGEHRHRRVQPGRGRRRAGGRPVHHAMGLARVDAGAGAAWRWRAPRR